MLLLAIVIVCVILFNFSFHCFNERKNVAAIVNGEYIYVEDINDVLSEYEETDGVTYDVILENTINELLIVQYGKNKGLEATDAEI